MTSLTFEAGSQLAAIPTGTFEGAILLESVIIPNSVSAIGDSAFKDCNALASVSFPQSCTSIYANAFSGCMPTSIAIRENITQPTAANVALGTVYGPNNSLVGTKRVGGGVNGSGVLGMI